MRHEEIESQVAKITKQLLQPLSIESFRSHQKTDEFCSNMVNYLTNEMLPENDTTARSIVLKAYDYIIHKGLLYWVQLGQPYNKGEIKLVVPRKLAMTLAKVLHENNSHLGVLKLLALAKRMFYWNSMYKDILNFMANCKTC